MRESVLFVPAPADWINSNQRLHRMQVAKLTKAWRDAGRTAAVQDPRVPYAGRVHILAHIWKPRAGRYDAGNLYPTVKAILDGVVDSGLLADDSNEFVVGPDLRHGGKGGAGIVLQIHEIGAPCEIMKTAPEVLDTPAEA